MVCLTSSRHILAQDTVCKETELPADKSVRKPALSVLYGLKNVFILLQVPTY